MHIPLGPLIADINSIELDQCDREVLQHPKLGGLILFSRNYESPEQLSGLIRQIREQRANLPICVDHEGGRVQRFRDGFSAIPPMAVLGEHYQHAPEQALEDASMLGYLLAYELTVMDVDHSFAPVLDLDDGRSRVIGDRAFSADADITRVLAAAFIQGMNEAGMAATLKHFPGHGGVVEDSHLELPTDTRSFEQLWQHDLVPFRDLHTQAAAIMTAHVCYPSLCAQPVSFSSEWIGGILRQKIGFSGLVLSDDLTMKATESSGDFKQRSALALEAGCDGLLICNQRPEAECVLEWLEANQLGETNRLQRLKHQLSLDDAEKQQKYQLAKSVLDTYQ